MKDFESIYNEVYQATNTKFEEIKNKNKQAKRKYLQIPLIIFAIFIVLYWKTDFVLLFFIASMAILYLIFGGLYALINSSKDTEKVLSNEVIPMIVSGYDKKLKYTSSLGINEEVYLKGFPEKYDNYKSQNMISGSIDGYKIEMADVDSMIEYRDSQNKVHHRIIFSGMVAVLDINANIDCNINAWLDHKKMLKFLEDPERRIEMDSLEFENQFDVTSDDKVQAMQILTADIMELLMEYINENKTILELGISKNKLYIRFRQKLFIVNDLNYNRLKNDFEQMDKMFDIIKKIVSKIEQN